MMTYEVDLGKIAKDLDYRLVGDTIQLKDPFDYNFEPLKIIKRSVNDWPGNGLGRHCKPSTKGDISGAIVEAIEAGHSNLYLYFQGGVI